MQLAFLLFKRRTVFFCIFISLFRNRLRRQPHQTRLCTPTLTLSTYREHKLPSTRRKRPSLPSTWTSTSRRRPLLCQTLRTFMPTRCDHKMLKRKCIIKVSYIVKHLIAATNYSTHQTQKKQCDCPKSIRQGFYRNYMTMCALIP